MQDSRIFIAGSSKFTTDSYEYWSVLLSVNGGKTFSFIDRFLRDSSAGDCAAYGIAIDSNNNIYVCGYENVSTQNQNWIVRKSTTGASGSFSYVDSVNRENGADTAYGIAIDSNNNIYVCGREFIASQNYNWIVRKSTTGASGSFSYVDSVNGDAFGIDTAYGIAIDSNNNIYVCGAKATIGENQNWTVRKSTTGASGSFSEVDSIDRETNTDVAYSVTTDRNNSVYVCGYESLSVQSKNWIVRKSTTGASGSFSYVDSVDIVGSLDDVAYDVITDSKNNVYVCGFTNSAVTRWTVRKSTTGASGSFNYVDVLNGNGLNVGYGAYSIAIDNADTLYVVGVTGDGTNKAVLRKGRLTANSASLGPITFSPSFGYVQTEVTGNLVEKFNLANVSEFPHGSGLFQMKNMVLGTTSAGKLGKTDDAIIQVKNIGSTVRIMWPSQGSQDTDVRGIGDFSTGQRPGRLNNETQYGDFYDCTKFDHMTLYCGVQKQVSGTIDDLLISVERRPFTNTAFAIEQGISYSTSGSYTVGQLTDLVYKKQINFGDLTNREIVFPIDIPLTNTKEIRISAKLSSGQSAENSNLIVWGRFVKSNSQQTET